MGRRYFEPQTLDQALRVLGEHPDAGIIAGGTDLVVADRSGKRALPASLIAIHNLPELREMGPSADGALRVGALVTHAQLETSRQIRDRYMALADAATLVGSPATRHVGTLGGNICNASPAMEAGSPLLIFEATVELVSLTGPRLVPLAQFLVGPSETTRKQGELLTAVLLPRSPVGHTGSAYLRLEYRRAMEIAVVGAAAIVSIDETGRCDQARLSLTAVASTCARVPEAEAILTGQQLTASLIERASVSAAAAAKPIDDVRASAAYRRAMVAVIVSRTLSIAWRRANGNSISNPATAGDKGTTAGG